MLTPRRSQVVPVDALEPQVAVPKMDEAMLGNTAEDEKLKWLRYLKINLVRSWIATVKS